MTDPLIKINTSSEYNPYFDYIGNEFWFDDDHQYHRDNHPAVIGKDGYLAYYQHGKRHRLDGPAISGGGVEDSWYINGEQVCCKNNEIFLRIMKLKELL
jgi:hypothetical protein